MIALIFSIFCFVLSIYEAINARDIAAIILMSSSIIWHILYLIALSTSNRINLIKTFLERKGGKDS